MTRDESTQSSTRQENRDGSDEASRNHEKTRNETEVRKQNKRKKEQKGVGPGAETPNKITHCFTLKGYHWAYAMLEGEREREGVMGSSKVIENRHFRITPGWYGVVVGKGMGRREDYEMVKRTLPGMSIPAWESQQSKRMRGKIVGIVQITHSVKTEVCTTSPWATGPVCNIITRAAWLPTWVDGRGGQGVHPIKGGGDVAEQVRLQAQAAQVWETPGSRLHPETDETETRTKRKKQGTNKTKMTSGTTD